MHKVAVITGQTATGKTAHALELALATSADIISVDSRQIYSKLNIITGKDVTLDSWTPVENLHGLSIGYFVEKGIKMWGCDIVDPKAHFSSFDFVRYVSHILNNTIDAETTPIVVGGTYLYLQHLLYGIDTQVGADWELRSQLEEASVSELQDILAKEDPSIYNALNDSDRHNPHRLMRKIELARNAPGETTTKHLQPLFDITSFIGLHFSSPEKMKERITARVHERISRGAFEEVGNLLKEGYTSTDPGLKTPGYTQLIAHLHGSLSKDEAVNQWITAELQFAKRQWTFMKRNSDIDWKSA